MPCNDPNMISLSIAQPGDVCDIWLEHCSPLYYNTGLRTFVDANGQRTDSPVGESQLSQAHPLRYVYRAGELNIVSLLFDPTGATGRSAEVHAEIRTAAGAVRHQWCTTIRSGTPDPDFASHALKGV